MTETAKKTLVLIDGHSLAFRVYYGLERTGMSTSRKEPVWAVYGFFNAIFSLLQKIQPDAMAMSFDVGRETFRTEMYPEYKAHREKMPDEMRVQMDWIREGVEKLGIPIYELKGYEADDVIGTLSRKAAAEGYYVQILTGDQDAFQLVEDGCIEVLIPPRTPKDEMKLYNREAVFAKLGVYPEQVTDFKGLKGDTSDNIPGVPGVGDKTAVKLLTDYQSLEGVYSHVEEITGKLKERLETYREQAKLSKELAIINKESPIDADFAHCNLQIPDLAAFFEYLDRMEFKRFKQQAPELLRPFLSGQMVEPSDANGVPKTQEVTQFGESLENPSQAMLLAKASGHLQIPHEVITTEVQLNQLVTQLKAAGVFALDIETTGLDCLNDKLVGISFGWIEGEAPWQKIERPAVNVLHLTQYPEVFGAVSVIDEDILNRPVNAVYIPVAHMDAVEQVSEKALLESIGPLLADETLVKIAHNAKFEMNFLQNLGQTFNGLVLDTMLMSYVHQAERKHGLKALAYEVFGWQMQEITELIGTGKKQITFDAVPHRPAAAYGACDSYVTVKLAAHFLHCMDEDRKTLLYELELPVMHVLAAMEQDGIALDVAYLNKLSEELGQKLSVIEADIYTLAGEQFNINSSKQVGDILFEKMAIAPLRKTKGKTGYSTDAKVLEELAGTYPIAQKLLDYRQLYKLKSTYVDSLPEMVNPKTKHVHTSFNQTVAATGRLSSSDPNLQNIPIRSEEGRLIRAAFVPGGPGEVLLSADYSQIELRLLAHYSEDPNLIAAFQASEDIHTATAALVFGLTPEQVTKEMRYKAKAVNFGVIYGQTAHGLSQQLKIPRAEAAEFIDRYFARYPSVRRAIELVQATAKTVGYVNTLCGRMRNLSAELNSSNRNVREFAERAAFNTVLQGSAADLMKVAMIRLKRDLDRRKLASRMLLQVHDELVLSVPKDEIDEVKTLVETAMTLDQPLRVPLVVDCHVGPNWMEK